MAARRAPTLAGSAGEQVPGVDRPFGQWKILAGSRRPAGCDSQRPTGGQLGLAHSHVLPGSQPLENLAIALADFTGMEKTPAAIRSRAEEYRSSERTLALTASLGSGARRRAGLVVLVDQFEEVFTQCSDVTARQALIDNLMVAGSEPGGQTLVVLTLRADLYGECSAHPVLAAALSDHQVLVGPMQEAELRWRSNARRCWPARNSSVAW